MAVLLGKYTINLLSISQWPSIYLTL